MKHETGAEHVRWDLTHLYPSDQSLREDLPQLGAEAETFNNQYAGRVHTLEGPALLGMLNAYAALQDRFGRAYTYAYLNWSTETTDSERGRLLQEVKEAYARFAQQLVFVEVEWAQIPESEAGERVEGDAFLPYRHHLELLTRRRAHVLSEPVERALAEAEVTGRGAWVRFFDQLLAQERFDVEGESLTEQEVLSRLHEADRETRRKAALAFTEGLERLSPQLTYVFNTVLADKASQDRMRSYPSWLSSRNLSNEVADSTVEALVTSVTARYEIAQRFYALKRRLLGLDTLHDYDRYAPVGQTTRRWDWADARVLVSEAYAGFHPELGAIVERFFEERWIDAPAAPGKRGGAFSHGAVPSAHPYILMNYTGRVRDVQTLAHELGHGVHQYLSREQGVLQADTPLTTAETASVFGEMLTFQQLLGRESDPAERLAMLVSKIDDSMATVFRQVSMNRFEDRIHTARRLEGELSAEQYGALWRETQQSLYGQAVSLGDHYTHWWSYIPHFLHTPGYVYAYAFGELLVLALYERYLEEGEAFAERYLKLLSAGGSDWPHRLVAKLGVDLEDPGFWNGGLDAIERLVEEAESLADSVQVASHESSDAQTNPA